MKIVIQQYLATLKESKELDAILPDLLLAMNIQTITKPQIGVRQYGVDLCAVGKDPDDNIKKLFLFVIKCGDLGRNEWNVNKQAVRPTLEEINDSYLTHFIPVNYKDLPIKIVLVTGGNLLQETQSAWDGYILKNKTERIQYDLWCGEKLAILFHQYLFNEQILIQEYRSLFRKSLVMLSEPSYNLKEFYELFDNLVLKINSSNNRSNKRNIKTCKLILRIAIEWAKEANNYKHCINIAEHCILQFWNTIRKFSLDKKSFFIDEFLEYYLFLYNLLVENNDKFAKLYSIEDGLHGYTQIQSPEVEGLLVYEQLGFLSELGILAFYEYTRFHDEKYYQSLINVSGNIKSLLDNHKSLLNPLYDEHIIEVCLASYVLLVAGEREYLKNWLYKSFDHIIYACTVLGKYYPTCTNNFYDLLYESKENQKEYLCSSTLFFYYLELACLIKDNDLYSFVYDNTMEHFSETAIQFWFPDSTTEENIYIRNAGYSSGFSFVCNPLPKTLKEMDDIINTKKEKEISCKDFSCFKNSFTDLLFISNRHFRTPIIPDTFRVLKTLLYSINEKHEHPQIC